MADNTLLNLGSGGDTIASDDIGGVKYQRVKLIHGADGSNAGDVQLTAGLPIVGSNATRVTGAWTSATAGNTTIVLPVTGFSSVVITMSTTSTITGGAVAFEGSDDGGSNYKFAVSTQLTNSPVVHNTWNIAVADLAWFAQVAGFTHVRLRLSTVITGTGTSSVALIGCALPAGMNTNPGVPRAAVSTLSNVSSSATNVTLLALKDTRVGVLLVNDSTANLFLKYGATASSTSYTVKIGSGGYWEMPQPIWAGQVDGIWDAANGAARITELSAV